MLVFKKLTKVGRLVTSLGALKVCSVDDYDFFSLEDQIRLFCVSFGLLFFGPLRAGLGTAQQQLFEVAVVRPFCDQRLALIVDVKVLEFGLSRLSALFVVSLLVHLFVLFNQ